MLSLGTRLLLQSNGGKRGDVVVAVERLTARDSTDVLGCRQGCTDATVVEHVTDSSFVVKVTGDRVGHTVTDGYCCHDIYGLLVIASFLEQMCSKKVYKFG